MAIVVISASIVGLLFFIYGFFLTRRELGEIAYAVPIQLNSFIHKNYNFDNCNVQSSANNVSIKPRKVFLFIIDALRLDFMSYQPNSNLSSYNQFKYMHQLLRYNASQSMLFGFRADPPTVTSQRLKGLTTGTLPTFVDIGSNFNCSAITEDNIIDQLVRLRNNKNPNSNDKGSKLKILGDDTWLSLFPTQFDTPIAFDSFDTKDLDTVDNGILQHLTREMTMINSDNNASNYEMNNTLGNGSDNDNSNANNTTNNMTTTTGVTISTEVDWSLFIAHFLGVDHIGHTHDAFHPLMAQRLSLMDTILMQVINNLPDDTVLMMFGDHGMTDSGEHGGASTEETDSGLFIYCKQPMFTINVPIDNNAKIDTVGNKNDNSNIYSNNNENNDCRRGIHDNAVIDYDNYTTPYWNEVTQSFVNTTLYSIRSTPRIVSQINLTPTLSVLLGTPTPYSSLGMVIPELFLYQKQQQRQVQQHQQQSQNCIDNGVNTRRNDNMNSSYNNNDLSSSICSVKMFLHQPDYLSELLFVNALQVWRYLLRYFKPNKTTAATTADGDSLIDFDVLFETAEAATCADATAMYGSGCDASAARVRYIQQVLPAANVINNDSNSSNSKYRHNKLFELQSLLIDVILLHLNAMSNNISENATFNNYSSVRAKYIQFLTEVQRYGRQQWTEFNIPVMLLGLVTMFVSLIWMVDNVTRGQYNIRSFVGSISNIQQLRQLLKCTTNCFSQSLIICSLLLPLTALFHALSAVSNSFVIFEHYILLFMMQCSAGWLGAVVLYHDSISDSRNGTSKSHIGTDNSKHDNIYVFVNKYKHIMVVAVMMIIVRFVWEYKGMTTVSSSNFRHCIFWCFVVLLSLLCQYVWFRMTSYHNDMSHDNKSPYNIATSMTNVTNGLQFLSHLLLVLYWYIKESDTTVLRSTILDTILHLIKYKPRIILCTTLLSTAVELTLNYSSTKLNKLIHITRALFMLVLLYALSSVQGVMIMTIFVHVMLYVWVTTDVVFVQTVNGKYDSKSSNQHNFPTFDSCNQQRDKTYDSSNNSDKNSKCDNCSNNENNLVNNITNHLLAASQSITKSISPTTLSVTVNITLYFSCVGRFVFFVTGHRMDFGTLQLSVGFIGTDKFNYIYAGFALAVNTFGYEILSVFGLFIVGVNWDSLYSRTYYGTDSISIITKNDNSTTNMRRNTSQQSVKYNCILNKLVMFSILYRILVIFMSCVAAAVLRRHLMLWAVFAPKVAFEAVIYIATGIIYILLHLYSVI